MKSADYWNKRSEQIANRQFKSADSLNERLEREYRRAYKSIQKDIDAFYGRFASNNEVTMLEAKKILDKGELKEFKLTVEEFTKLAKGNESGAWTKELNNVYYRSRITRYEALQVQIQQQIEMLKAKEHRELTTLLSDTYTDTYYRTLYEIQKGVGFGVSFARVDTRALETVITKKWAGSDYSSRIWDDKAKLLRELEINLSQSFIRGDSLDKVTKVVQDRMNVSKSNAQRLVRTESAHIMGEATAKGYQESGVVKQYQFLATLDSRTSQVCQSMDNKVFNLSDKQIGVNYPPLHANCRSTTVAYFGDEEPSERIARGKDGKTYNVPSDMNYEEWHKKYIA